MARKRTITRPSSRQSRIPSSPNHLAKTGREEMIKAMIGPAARPSSSTAQESKFGAVPRPSPEARAAPERFKSTQRTLRIIITLPTSATEPAEPTPGASPAYLRCWYKPASAKTSARTSPTPRR